MSSESGAGHRFISTPHDREDQCVSTPSLVCEEADANDTTGVEGGRTPSSSTMVSVCVSAPPTWYPSPASSVSTTVSPRSSTPSSTIATGTVAVTAPAGTVSVPEFAIVKSAPGVAEPPTV